MPNLNSLLPLKLCDVHYGVDGRDLLRGIDLDISSPGITTIMGPNGAGKSLLVRLLHGLITPTSGHILWNEQPIDKGLRLRQAMVFQKPVLLRRSVAANIDFVLRLRHGHVDPKLRDILLGQAGLSAREKQPARRLSGGEQQRLALVRALAGEPEVLILDEPSASLDPASTQQIEDILHQSSAQGIKIILVTHDSGQARRLSGDVVFLHNGQITEHTPATIFFQTPESPQAKAYLAGLIYV